MIDSRFAQRYAAAQRPSRSVLATVVRVAGMRLPGFIRRQSTRRNLIVQLLLLLVVFNVVGSVSPLNVAHALDHDGHPYIAAESEHFGAHHDTDHLTDDSDNPLTSTQHELLHAMSHVQLFITSIALAVFSLGATVMPVLLIICAAIYKPSETPFRPPRNH